MLKSYDRGQVARRYRQLEACRLAEKFRECGSSEIPFKKGQCIVVYPGDLTEDELQKIIRVLRAATGLGESAQQQPTAPCSAPSANAEDSTSA